MSEALTKEVWGDLLPTCLGSEVISEQGQDWSYHIPWLQIYLVCVILKEGLNLSGIIDQLRILADPASLMQDYKVMPDLIHELYP